MAYKAIGEELRGTGYPQVELKMADFLGRRTMKHPVQPETNYREGSQPFQRSSKTELVDSATEPNLNIN